MEESLEIVDFAVGASIFNVKAGLQTWMEKTRNSKPTGRFGIGGYYNMLSPEPILEAMEKEVRHPTIYPEVNGWLRAREAVAARMERHYRVKVDPDTEVCLGCGGREILFVLLRSLLKAARKRKPGARKVIVSDPCYGGQYYSIIEAGGIPVCISSGPNHDYFGGAIEYINENGEEVVAVFVDGIHNPTGVCAQAKQMTAVAEAAASARVVVISDEVYQELIHNGDPIPSMAQLVPLQDGLIAIVRSGSKLYAMSRDRIGDLVASSAIVKDYVDERKIINYGPPSIIQAGYAAALNLCDDSIAELSARIAKRAEMIYRGFVEAGWINFPKPPRAGIFQLAPVPDAFSDALTFCSKAAEEYGLEIWPAAAFGHKASQTLRHEVRIPYVEHEDNLPCAFSTMKNFLSEHASSVS